MYLMLFGVLILTIGAVALFADTNDYWWEYVIEAVLAMLLFGILFLFVSAVASDFVHEEDMITEVTDTYQLVDVRGEYVITATEGKKTVQKVVAEDPRGYKTLTIPESTSYIAYEENIDAYLETFEVVAFRNPWLYLWTWPGMCDNTYIIHIPEEG